MSVPSAQTPVSDPSQIAQVVRASHSDIFGFLGPHRAEKSGRPAWIIRTFRPDAAKLKIVGAGGVPVVDAARVHPDGFFEAWLPHSEEVPEYSLEWTDAKGETHGIPADPYRFGNIMGEQDAHYFAEGRHWKIYNVLGAHQREMDGVTGMTFAVWAPNARRVSVVGDFNQWDGRIHLMRKRIESGIWEIFIPGLQFNTHYKFELVGAGGDLYTKSDPYAFFSQNREQTASITWNYRDYEWQDEAWMTQREKTNVYESPLSIYEVHLGSWARVLEDGERFLTYDEFSTRLVDHVAEMGFTHIQLMPTTEFPFDGSWGYQVTGYFAPTSRYGSPDDFRRFIDRCHAKGIGVILDWVPAHFPKDAHGLSYFDGTALYEHGNPLEGEHKDWGTLIFNFGRNEVRNFLIASALFWFEQYHIDGLRVDAVASMLYRDYSREEGQWIPNQYGGRENLEAIHFLQELNTACYTEHPGIMMIAEESTAFGGVSRPVDTGGLGFGFKWNMGWMNDTLEYMSKDPIHRRFHHDSATFSMIYAYDENFVLVLSHDEVVHGKKSLLDKMPGDNWQKFANLRMLYAWMFAHPGKKLLFQGSEIAPFTEWDFEKSLDWHLLQYPEHNGISRLLQDLNRVYKEYPALHQLDHSHEGFEWVDGHDYENSTFTFLRKGKDGSVVLVAVNATPVPRPNYRAGVPVSGYWKEILNTDAEPYAGSNLGNHGGVETSAESWNARPYSIEVNLPPLGVVMFSPKG